MADKTAPIPLVLSAIRDDIALNFGTADQVRRANDNTRDELRWSTKSPA
jgi:hypothetical protein